MPKVLVIATFNVHKAEEFKAIISDSGLNYEIRCLKDYPDAESPKEDGKTFQENALIKARYAASVSGELSLGDDTGLEVFALGGAPGIFSARYAGEPPDSSENCRLLLRNMLPYRGEDRKARFVCSIALADPSGYEKIADGIVPGRILEKPIGNGGFGYDSLFMPDGYTVSYAGMDSDGKNSISHRAKAFRNILPELRKFV